MEKDGCTLLSLRQGITDNNLHVKAIIQVINRAQQQTLNFLCVTFPKVSENVSLVHCEMDWSCHINTVDVELFWNFKKLARKNSEFYFQDILVFRGSIAELENLNEAGRAKLSALRKYISQLDNWASDEGDPKISKEVELHRDQLSR